MIRYLMKCFPVVFGYMIKLTLPISFFASLMSILDTSFFLATSSFFWFHLEKECHNYYDFPLPAISSVIGHWRKISHFCTNSEVKVCDTQHPLPHLLPFCCCHCRSRRGLHRTKSHFVFLFCVLCVATAEMFLAKWPMYG